MADEESRQIGAEVKSTSSAIKHLLDRVAAWENYWRITMSKDLLTRFNRKWRALGIARKLRYALIQDIAEFEQEKGKTIAAINQDNPRLADELQKFAPVQETAIPNLGKLLAALNTNTQYANSFIKTHAEELIGWINSLPHDADQEELRRLIIEISGAEIAELTKCIADLESWTDFRIGNNVQFFSARIQAYLKGGMFNGKNFQGLVRHFKDKSLIAPIQESVGLRMLLTYPKQIEWFKRARATIAYSIYNPGWEGFRGKDGFYSNLMEGKNYIGMIKKRFGNKDTASYLENVYQTGSAGEVPKLWLPHIDEALARIKDPSYFNRDVILPARDSLISIFSRRKEELAAIDFAARLEELGIVLRRFFKKAIARSRNLINFDSLLKIEQKKLEKEINAEKRAFVNVLLDHGEQVIDFVNTRHMEIEEKERDMNYYIGAYVYLTKSKLKALAKRIRGASIFETTERMRQVEEKEEIIGVYASEELRTDIKEAKRDQPVLAEKVKQASLVDSQLRLAVSNYYPRGKWTILNPEYLI